MLAELSNGDPTQKRSLMESLFAVDYSQFEQALNNLKTSRSAVRCGQLYRLTWPLIAVICLYSESGGQVS